MKTDVVVVGAGLSGLTAAALLAKRGLDVAVVDKAYCPGGTCGSFKRRDTVYDQGTAMLFGFGEAGFIPHRFVFNALEQPFDIIRHDAMYAMDFAGRRVEFYTDMARFVDGLCEIFPTEAEGLRRFYSDLDRLYQHVIVPNPPFTTPDETDFATYQDAVKNHPVSYLRFLSFMFRDTHSLLKKYFKDEQVFQFFDKLCSTYCYTPARETPAVLGAVMFIENHQGGSFYPAGGAMQLPGRLEKAVEDGGGRMVMRSEVSAILVRQGRAAGVQLTDGRQIHAGCVVYAGNVWDLYAHLLPTGAVPDKKRKWAEGLEPTLPSCIVNLKVRADVIPPGTLPTEMLAANPERLDESELTVYVSSLDDATLCEPGFHTVTAIGPTFETWEGLDRDAYHRQKRAVLARVLRTLETRFPGITGAVEYASVGTPRTLQRYAHKWRGAAAGPKQKMGQHMLKRQHIRTDLPGLYCCGEGTVMGTGTPAVTISGLTAANTVLKDRGLAPFAYEEGMPDYVRVVKPGYTRAMQYCGQPPEAAALMRRAARCQFCEHPSCNRGCPGVDVPGILRRLAVENLRGAARLAAECGALEAGRDYAAMEAACVRGGWAQPVPLGAILPALAQYV